MPKTQVDRPTDVAMFFILRHFAVEIARLRAGSGDVAGEITKLQTEIETSLLNADIYRASGSDDARQEAQEFVDTLLGGLALDIRQRGG